MNLLLIDKQGLATYAREEILHDQYHHHVDYVFTFEDFKAKYAVGRYNIVIVDFALEAGVEALKMIDSLDPKQRVIILSAIDDYSEHKGCAYCVEHHNRRRLKEPVSIADLANLIKNFDYTTCAHYHD
ncbi:response regulator [Thiomicrolovo sp. ZZH C-3]